MGAQTDHAPIGHRGSLEWVGVGFVCMLGVGQAADRARMRGPPLCLPSYSCKQIPHPRVISVSSLDSFRGKLSSLGTLSLPPPPCQALS